jgi:hypothetical protein
MSSTKEVLNLQAGVSMLTQRVVRVVLGRFDCNPPCELACQITPSFLARPERLAALHKREDEVNQELGYVGDCLAAQAAQRGGA